jgi:hypothetical protein
MSLQRTLVVFAALLLAPLPASAAGLGWYYESFSWPALQAYLGGRLRYDGMSPARSRAADAALARVLNTETGLRELKVRSETDPDYIHSGAFLHLLDSATPKARAFLMLFEYGRSYGQAQGRTACASEVEGGAWACLDAYVLLSPEECTTFGKELLAMLASPTFVESEYGEREFVTPFAKALIAAGKRKRGMYVHATD